MRAAFRDWSAAALLFAILLAGCDARPSAPPLEDGPVFRDRREGFRFSVPDGWKQRARGMVPSGKIAGERMLVEYRCTSCAVSGSLLVSVADVSEATELGAYLTSNSRTGEVWRLSGAAVDFTINGAPAARIVHKMRAGKEELVREVVAFRRGERVYFFKGFYAVSEPESRTAIKAAVETVVW